MQDQHTELQLTPPTSTVVFTPESGLNAGVILPCICERKPAFIVCKNEQCDFASGDGRVRKFCPSHPKITFLMDLVHCPKCESECNEFNSEELGRIVKNQVSRSSPPLNQQQTPKIKQEKRVPWSSPLVNQQHLLKIKQPKQQATVAENRSKYRPALTGKNRGPGFQQSTKKFIIADP